MKVKDLLDIQEVLTKRVTPEDMNNEDLTQHYSQSKEKYMHILDMDLIHLIRSYSKCLGEGYEYIDVNNKEKIREHLDKILSETYNTRELLGD
jgi:hypothetical protein